MHLPNNWQRLSTNELLVLRDKLDGYACDFEDDDAAEEAQYESDLITDELYLREHGDDLDPIDYDAQDRRAASEERIENHRRER